jgi:predicted cytidylate kinase
MAIITIGGNPGSGKTTLAVKLAAQLHYEELYVGGIFRERAAERGITVEEFTAEIKNDPALERSIDERQKKLMQEKDNLVIQGRVAWFFAQKSPFKVINLFLATDHEIGARRVAERKEDTTKSIEEIAQATAERIKHDQERYKKLYDIPNYLDPGHYDIILDTSRLTEEEVLSHVLQRLEIFGITSVGR